jgi:hypothetical protein
VEDRNQDPNRCLPGKGAGTRGAEQNQGLGLSRLQSQTAISLAPSQADSSQHEGDQTEHHQKLHETEPPMLPHKSSAHFQLQISWEKSSARGGAL